MTNKEIYEFYEKQIEFHTRGIENYDEQIKWTNDMIKALREQDREFVKRIWEKGVVDKFEMEHYNNKYESKDTKWYIKERAWAYKQRNWHRKNLASCEEMASRFA